MSKRFDNIRKPRTIILTLIEGLSLEQLNTIPAGFNNNILWNLGHMVAVQYGICYKRAGLDLPIDEAFFDTYKSGTKPERIYTADDLAQIKELMSAATDQLEADVRTDMFNNYTAWTARYGNEIGSVDDAIAFLPFHEGLHIGTIVAMKKLV